MIDAPSIARLTAACGCGATVSIECPTVGDIPAARTKMTGWGYDDRGMVKCPKCLPPATESPP